MLTYVKIFEEEKASKDIKVIPTKKGGSADRTKMLSKPRYLCMTGKHIGHIGTLVQTQALD